MFSTAQQTYWCDFVRLADRFGGGLGDEGGLGVVSGGVGGLKKSYSRKAEFAEEYFIWCFVQRKGLEVECLCFCARVLCSNNLLLNQNWKLKKEEVEMFE